MSILFPILWIACSAASFYIYHKLFDVIYLNLTDGCLKEIIGCAIVGAIIAALIVKFWYVSIPLVILLIIAFTKKKS